MLKLSQTDVHGTHVARTFPNIEEAKAILSRAPFNVFMIEEDEDFPGHYDMITKSGQVYSLTPA